QEKSISLLSLFVQPRPPLVHYFHIPYNNNPNLANCNNSLFQPKKQSKLFLCFFARTHNINWVSNGTTMANDAVRWGEGKVRHWGEITERDVNILRAITRRRNYLMA